MYIFLTSSSKKANFPQVLKIESSHIRTMNINFHSCRRLKLFHGFQPITNFPTEHSQGSYKIYFPFSLFVCPS